MLLIFLITGWIAGIFTAAFLNLPIQVWYLFLFLPLGYLILFWRNPLLRQWHLVLLFFVLGALRFHFALPNEADKALAQFNEQGRASLVGIVIAQPEIRQSDARVRVDVSKIQIGGQWRDTSGRALVLVPRDTPVKYGDEVQVDGAPTTPPDGADFSYRDYLARQAVFTLVRNARLYVIASDKGDSFWAALYDLKDVAHQAINQLLPEPSASLLAGILLGDDRGIPSDVRDAFNATNTAHIIAISGFNVGILVFVLAFIFRRPAAYVNAQLATSPSSSTALRGMAMLGQLLSTILILVVLVLYTLLVGAEPSVVRACVMGGLAVIAFQLGRQTWALTSLAFAGFVLTLLNPYALWDVGFQLSFLATLGLVLYAPRLQNALEGLLAKRTSRAKQIVAFFQEAIIVTTAAVFVTAPLMILYFHRVSLIGFLTNFLILPVQPPIMLVGGAATLLQMAGNALNAIPFVGLIFSAAAQGIAWGAFVCLQYTILVVQATATVPFGSFEVGRIDTPIVMLFYALLFGVTALGVKKSAELVMSRAWIVIGLLALSIMFVWATALAAPDPRTRITFVAASDGDATFIRTASDQRILINGTDEPSTLLSFLGGQLPPWDRRLDVVIATHLEDDNLASLNAVLERFNVAQVVAPPVSPSAGVSYEKWRELTEKLGIEQIPAEQGTVLHAGEVQLEVIHTTADRRLPTALLMTANGQNFLIAPALGKSDQLSLLKNDVGLDAEMAVLPNEVEPEFVKRVAPSSVVLFVGRRPNNQFSAETLKLLSNSTVWRTDVNGNIEFVLDEDKVQVQTAK